MPPALPWILLSFGAHASVLIMANHLLGGVPLPLSRDSAGADANALELRLAPTRLPPATGGPGPAPRPARAIPRDMPSAPVVAALPSRQQLAVTATGAPVVRSGRERPAAAASSDPEHPAPAETSAPGRAAEPPPLLAAPPTEVMPLPLSALQPADLASGTGGAASAYAVAERAAAATAPAFTPPAYVSAPAPVYPPEARQAGLEGVVVVRVRIGSSGSPLALQIQSGSGHAVLDEAARLAVGQWRFLPARREGSAVAAWMDVPIRFRLADLPPP